MMKTRVIRFSKRSLSTFMAFLIMLTAIGIGSLITVTARNGSTMYVCVSDKFMADADANEVWVNVKKNEKSNENNWTSAELESTNKFYGGKRIYSIVGVEDTTWGGLGCLQIQLKKDGTWKQQKEPKSNDGKWWSSSNYANKIYNYSAGSFPGTYSDASYATGFTTGDYYIHNNVNGAWYGNGTDAPKMTKVSDKDYYYDFYLKKNEVNTSNYLIFKFWDASDELQIGPDYESDHRCTLSTSGSWSSSVQSISNYGDKDTAWQVNTSGWTANKFNRVRITLDPKTLSNSRNGRVKFTKTELANMDPTFSTTSFTKGTSYNLTNLVGVTSGSNAGTVSYSTYEYYDTSWHTISSPSSWTPTATNITKLRVTATDGGVITTAGTTKNAITARTETKETAITVSLATHTVSRSSAPSNGSLELSSDNTNWGTSSLTIAEGSNYYIKATPNTGYKINTLTVAGSTVSEASNSTSAYTHTGTMSTSNVTTSCTFSPQSYSITYKDQGDVTFSGTHASGYPTTHTYGTATNLKTATKTGYDFGGWYTSSDCSGSAVTSLGATDYTDGITLYAKWTIKSYSITLSESGTTGGVLKVDGVTASTATHDSHTFRVGAPAGYEISSISSTGASWTNHESYATSSSVSITSDYTISVTYIKSANPALQIDYTGAAGTTYTATNGDSVTTSTRHNVTVTFTNQSSFDNGTSYTVTQKIGSNAATTIASGTTSSSGGNIVAKSAGTLSAGTYLYTVTVGSKSTAITVVVNQSYSLAIPSVSGATLSASFTDEFGNAQLKTVAGTYYAKSGTSYTVTYTADSDHTFSSSSNTSTTSSVSSTVSSNTSVTAPTIYEKKFTLTKNTYKTNADSTTSSSSTTTTLTTVTGTDVASGQQAGYYVTSWQVTSGTVYVDGTAYTSSSGVQSIAASSTSYTLSSVTIKAAATVRFNFTESSYTLTKKKKVGDAAVANIGTQACYRVTKSTVTAPEITGYKVSSWQITTSSNYFYVNGTLYNSASGVQDIEDVATYTISDVTLRGAATIQFNYVETTYTVTVQSAKQNSVALGTVTPASGSAGIATALHVSATPKTGYAYSSWSGEDLSFSNISTTNGTTTADVTATGTSTSTRTATANFKRTRVYLDVASYWTIGSNNVNHFAAYFFWNNDANREWVTMTAVDGETGKYYANIPTNAITAANYKIVFVALNNASNAWGNKVYQTGDLTPCASGETLKNLYTLTSTGGGSWNASPYFPPRTYSVIVNAAEHGTVGGATTQTVQVPDEGDAYTLPAPQGAYGYKFTGWEVISGSIKYNNTDYTSGVFSTNATTAIIANAASSVRANFDYNDSMNLRIGGRFRAKNGSGTFVYTSGASAGNWNNEGTDDYLEFLYNSTDHYYYLNTNDTLANVASYKYNNEGAYFHIYDADNSKYWNPSSNHTFTDSNNGTENKVDVVDNSTQNFIFSSSSNDGPVTICFDPIAKKVWYTIPARHTAELGTISRTVRSTTTTDTNGGTVKINNGTSSINVSEGTNYAIKVTPVSGYQLTALTVNGTSIITGHENATSEFTINRAMGEGNSSYKETVSATFTAIQYSVTVGSNSTNSSNTVKFKVNSDSTQYTEKTDVTVADTITPVVAVNSSAGYNIRSIKLQEKTGTSSYTDRVQLANNSATQMKAYNARIYVAYGAISPVMSNSIAATTGASPENISVSTYTINNAYAGQAVTITPSVTTNGTITYASSNLTNGYGTATLSYNSSTKKFTFTSPKYIGDSAGANPTYTFRITPTNTPETGISASGTYKTVTIKVIYSTTQQAYMNLKTKYDEYAGYEITSDDIESGWSDFNSAMTTANTALGTFPNSIPEWNASDSYTAKKTALETAYSNLVFKETTIYVLSKYEHSNSSYVNIYLFNNSTATHDPSPIFYTDTSLTTINNTARNYHMTYEGETNDHKHLYSFTYRGHQEFIIYRQSSETNTLTGGAKLTGDIDLRNTTNYPYGEYYIDVKNTDVTSSPSVTSASTFTDFSISATGADSDLMVGQCKEGATGYTVSQIQSWLGITFNGSLASTSSQTVAQTYTITGPVGRGVPTEATVDSDHNWVPLKPGRYTVSLNASLGTDERASAGATFTGSKSTVGDTQTVLDLFVAFDDIEIYADMNGNVGTPTIHFTYTYTDNQNQIQTADLPYEFDMVTGSESVYSYTISVSTLKDVYHIDLLNGAHTETVGGQTITYRAAQVTSISIDSVVIENSGFSIARDAARTGTLWLKADSTHMKTFNKIAYGSSTRTFKAVLRTTSNGEDTDEPFNNSFVDVSGTGIITDELVGDSYQYSSFYAADDGTYSFSYKLRAKAQTDITHKETVNNEEVTNYYYFDHWEDSEGNAVSANIANGTDINILSAPNYSTDADVTYVAVYKPVTTKERVEITYHFKDFDTSDGNYEFDSSKTPKDESYTKTVKLGEGVLSSYSSVTTSNASAIAGAVVPIIQSNYFDYHFDTTTNYNNNTGSNINNYTIVYDSGKHKYKINAYFKDPYDEDENIQDYLHTYKIVVINSSGGSSVRTGYYQQKLELKASDFGITSGSSYHWSVYDGSTPRTVVSFDSSDSENYISPSDVSFTPRFMNSNGINDSKVQIIRVDSGTATVSASSSITYGYSIKYYDDDTEKAQHNFYIIDALTSSSGTLVGGGVLYATATDTTENGGTYRQPAAGTHLASDASRKAYINGILNGTYDKEYKAQTINNVGFRYLPYDKGSDVFRYSDEMNAYVYTFAGTNTNNSSLGTQTLRVFSFFVYDNNGTKNVVVSSTYAECSRYVS